MSELKILAMDEEDLQILSAHLQDAVVRVADMGLARADRRFAALLNRFAWEDIQGAKAKAIRKRTALRFDHVKDVRATGINLKARDGVLELLSIRFEPVNNPGGEIHLEFAGGGTVILEVECVEARLHDLGAAWAASGVPAHRLEDQPAEN